MSTTIESHWLPTPLLLFPTGTILTVVLLILLIRREPWQIASKLADRLIQFNLWKVLSIVFQPPARSPSRHDSSPNRKPSMRKGAAASQRSSPQAIEERHPKPSRSRIRTKGSSKPEPLSTAKRIRRWLLQMSAKRTQERVAKFARAGLLAKEQRSIGKVVPLHPPSL